MKNNLSFGFYSTLTDHIQQDWCSANSDPTKKRFLCMPVMGYSMWTFSLTDHGRIDSHSDYKGHVITVKHTSVLTMLKCISMQMPCGSRIKSIFTKRPPPAQVLPPFCIPVAGKYQNKLLCKIWSNYTMWFKSYEQIRYLTTTDRMMLSKYSSIKKGFNARVPVINISISVSGQC